MGDGRGVGMQLASLVADDGNGGVNRCCDFSES